ncbi:MAG TPA: bile acid:sodium symporter family protein [Marinospirillum sp.]|uniref:bile acid:sodium symporter family protein n=1 Tax=Marinospirillum sp. TaxID=2183934 RepID=UPI002B490205|nr:bile acid:sodium symporter family protein [Marinospirillum sp.]HKM15538.1 bile acid:sodium symporter family protein [Marinospirillum sp.]
MWQAFRRIFDNYTLLLLTMVLLATFVPAQGQGEFIMTWLTRFAVGLLFFLHGARLSRQAILAGIMHWRLHGLVFSFTFLAFPLLGWLLQPVLRPLLGNELAMGMLYLCALPGTVQSAIAFTALARGNLAAAVCSASASSLIGILVTPLLVLILLNLDATGAGFSFLDTLISISLQLLVPFLAGHLLRPWIADWIGKQRSWLGKVDQTSILLVVYTAFSASVVAGLWKDVPLDKLLWLTLACCVLLALVLFLTTWLARRFSFNKEDEITIVFCASKKSMATGVPMAQVLFSGALLGPMLLPLMIFHQIQLMACAQLAAHYAKRTAETLSEK